MIKIKFKFTFNNNIWYWEKVFYCNVDELQQRITNYLDQKKMPFDLDTSCVKYEII